MNYIGSKNRLLPFLRETIFDVVGSNVSDKVFCDLFAGTGVVGKSFKKEVGKVISNDLEYYSFVVNRNYIGNHKEIDGLDDLIKELNGLEFVESGFIFNNYCWGGGSERLFYTDNNGLRIDTIRMAIEEWYKKGRIDDDIYFFLLCSLLEAADKVANVAVVYGAFLKKLKATALNELVLQPANYLVTDNSHLVSQRDANELIKEIDGDILYLDPPYNTRQYGGYYHLLNTIARYEPFEPYGKAGLHKYNRSNYCSKRTVKEEFEELIAAANFSYIFLSYNNEGLMSFDEIKETMSKFGKYSVVQTNYSRFKADNNREHLSDSTIEYLHVLEK